MGARLTAGHSWLRFKKIGTRFGGTVVTLAKLVTAAETRATEIGWLLSVGGRLGIIN